MAQSVRVEFVTLGKGAGGNPENIVTGIVGTSITLAVSNSATAAASRPAAPKDGKFDAIRLTAITNPVYVHWSDTGVDATLTNSMRLAVEVPEIVVGQDPIFSFIAESA